MKRLIHLLYIAFALLLTGARLQAQSPVSSESVPVSDDSLLQTNAVSAQRNIGDLIRVFGDGVLPSDQQCNKGAFFFGSGKIDGHVSHGSVAFFGSQEINGTVENGVGVFFGTLKLGSNAVVKGQVIVMGGTLERDPGAKLSQEPVEIARIGDYPVVASIGNWLRQGLLMGRPLPPGMVWVWWVAGAFFLVYLTTLVLFPRPVQACVQTLEQRPVGSFFAGLLLKVLLAPAVALLIATGFGVLAIPFLLLALLAACVFGKTALLQFTGSQIGRQIGNVAAQKPLIALVSGGLVFCVFYMIPVLGLIVWGVALLFALGAATLTAAGSMKRESAPSRIDVSPAPGQAPGGAAEFQPALTPAQEAGLRRVGFWLRAVALALDAFLFICIGFVVARLFGHATPALMFLAWGVYHVGMWTWKGTTIGGIILGLKLVRIDGQPIDVAVAIVRALSSLFSAMALGLGFFWAGWSREKRSWHDRIAGSVVVKMPKGAALV